MRSQDKIDVTVKRMPQWDGKLWVEITVRNGNSFVPSLHDIYRIVRAIWHCEDKKYPRRKGALWFQHFLLDACSLKGSKEQIWSYLQKRYEIPTRE